MRVEISTFAERPELTERLGEIDVVWPAFMGKDPVENMLHERVLRTFPDYCVVATDSTGRVVGHGRSIPFALDVQDRVELPDRGWDAVLAWGFGDRERSTPTDTVSALLITVSRELTGQGLAVQLLEGMRSAARQQSHPILVAPVRPTAKHLEPRTPMTEYAVRTRDDGLPYDPWLRTHVRIGGEIEKVAPASMTMSGSLAEWRSWTDLPFDRDGGVDVPGALVPVFCDTAQDQAVYVEPNVWVRHDLT